MQFIKMFTASAVVFVLLMGAAIGLSYISDISPIMTTATFALAIVAYLLSDEVIK